MDLLNPAILTMLCGRAGVRPERASGQHFLVHRRTLERIVTTVDAHPDDIILEVGAGFGVLTSALAASGARIIAIERDRRIIPILREVLGSHENVVVVESDVLRLMRLLGRHADRRAGDAEGGSPSARRSPSSTVGGPLTSRTREAIDLKELQHAIRGNGGSWKLAANLPYGITSDFLRLLFDLVGTGAITPPERAVLLLQREVVDRLTGASGSVGFLTILTALHATARRVLRVPSSSFWPPPRVESAVVLLEQFRDPDAIVRLLGGVPREEFLRVVSRAFVRRRQQIRKSLASLWGRDGLGDMSHALTRGVPSTARPEELDLNQWIAVVREIVESRR